MTCSYSASLLTLSLVTYSVTLTLRQHFWYFPRFISDIFFFCNIYYDMKKYRKFQCVIHVQIQLTMIIFIIWVLKSLSSYNKTTHSPTSTTLGSALCHPSRNQLGLLQSWVNVCDSDTGIYKWRENRWRSIWSNTFLNKLYECTGVS